MTRSPWVAKKKPQTRYLSENELRFTVPSLPAWNLDYSGPTNWWSSRALDIGNFRIDESTLGVVPGSLEIQSGDSATLLFKIDFEAPVGGIPIDIKTNIPASVIMPEAFIAAGDKTGKYSVRGGEPGEGKMIVTASGYEPIEIPVKVFKTIPFCLL
jgi:hypothetical protein